MSRRTNRPRKIKAIKINGQYNPTGLTMDERRLALVVLQSYEASITKQMELYGNLRMYGQMSSWREQSIRKAVYQAALAQLTGRQKSEGSAFVLQTHGLNPSEEDMDFVRRALGVTEDEA